jgi:hypothetical protein
MKRSGKDLTFSLQPSAFCLNTLSFPEKKERYGGKIMRIFQTIIFTMGICSLFISENLGSTGNIAHALSVGTATIDITPPIGMPMRGYAARKELSNGVWDPLLAKAIVLDDGKTSIAMITVDLIAPPPKEICDAIRQSVLEKHGISSILFIASHTHSGPSLKSNLPTREEPWLSTLQKKLLHAVDNAVSTKQQATVKVGYGSMDISYNRREVHPNGAVTMLFQNPNRKVPTPVDQTVGVVGFTDHDGNWIAELVHFACHPVVFGGQNLKYTAEFPGAMRDYVEKQLGGTCLFMQGACGNVNPFVRGESTDEGYALLRQEGEKLGNEVVRITESMQSLPSDALEIIARNYTTELDYRFDLNDEKVKEFYIKLYGKEYFDEFYKDRPPTIKAQTPIVMLGKQIAWVGFPGEFFNEFQIDLRKRSPIAHTFFLGYCDELFSYFPTIQAASEGGYGASYSTYVEVGAGERLVDRAIIALHQLAGNLKSIPEQ